MKFRLCVVGSAVLFSFALAGCGSDSSPGAPETTPSDAAPDKGADSQIPRTRCAPCRRQRRAGS